MTDHRIGTREEWLAARLELLNAEKELTRRSDELAEWRQVHTSITHKELLFFLQRPLQLGLYHLYLVSFITYVDG